MIADQENNMKFKHWLLKEEASPDDQTHIFDFDDTIATTDNPNVVMLYNNGQPAHQSEEEVLDWLKNNGVHSDELLKGPRGKAIDFIPNRKGYACYVDSLGLAKIQASYIGKEAISGVSEPPTAGTSILVDLTLSYGVNNYSTKPIQKTIDKIKRLNSAGAETMVLTARKGEGSGKSIHGHDVETTNSKDIINFLGKHGARPTSGVIGTAGGDKGDAIYRKTIAGKPENDRPEEIHFYDDHPKNTNNVAQVLGGKVSQDLYLYGPGSFATGKADANRVDKVIKGQKEKKKKF